MEINIFKYFTGVIFISVMLTACNKGTDDAPPPLLPNASLAVVHMIPDAGSFNFYLDGTRQNDYKISYLQSSGYLSVRSGLHSASVADSNYNTIASGPVNLKASYFYTLLVAGKLATNSVVNILLTDTANIDNTIKTPKIRFVNASAGSTPVDVFLNSKSFSNVAYKSVSGYLRADTGKVTLKVNYAGTSTNIISGSITLSPRSVYTLVAYGFQNGTGKTAFYLALITNH